MEIVNKLGTIRIDTDFGNTHDNELRSMLYEHISSFAWKFEDITGINGLDF